jgi:hypothetical protein
MDVGVVMSLMISFHVILHNLFPLHLNCCCISQDKLLSRMALETRGHAGNNPPPPPEPNMTQVLWLMLEDREVARAEHQANLATHSNTSPRLPPTTTTMVAMAMMSLRTSLEISRTPIPQLSPSPLSHWMPTIGSVPLRTS